MFPQASSTAVPDQPFLASWREGKKRLNTSGHEANLKLAKHGYNVKDHMALDIEKLRLLRATAEQMAVMSSVDLNLVLHEAGLPQLPSHWNGDDFTDSDEEDRKGFAIEILRDQPSTQIREIATALQQLFDAPHLTLLPSEPAPIRLFASHLDTQQRLVREVAHALVEIFSVSLFVAHTDIPIDDEWHAAIESNLQAADAGVTFLHPGFVESTWCDQEVGWMLGRGIPVFTLKFAAQVPYGPLGKKQALAVEPTATASTIADHIVSWIRTKPVLSARLNASLTTALAKSSSYATTDRIWKHLQKVQDLTTGQVGTVASALRDNSQIYGASCRVAENNGQWYPEVILPLLLQQPGYNENLELLAEVARLRDIEHLLP